MTAKVYDDPVGRVIKYVYEVGGTVHEATPVDNTELSLPDRLDDGPCDGHYICLDGTRYRYMYDHQANHCRYFRTNEVC
jgi:hypothetical protein